MKSTHCKRKPCADISNVGEDKNNKSCKYSAEDMFPMNVTTLAGEKAAASVSFEVQNVHPALARYQFDAKTDHMSHDDLLAIIDPNREQDLIRMLQQCGVVAGQQQCVYCGGQM